VIASSGVGAPANFSDVFNETNASAALAVGIFHRKEVLILLPYRNKLANFMKIFESTFYLYFWLIDDLWSSNAVSANIFDICSTDSCLGNATILVSGVKYKMVFNTIGPISIDIALK